MSALKISTARKKPMFIFEATSYISFNLFFKSIGVTIPCHVWAEDGPQALSPGPGSHSRSGWPAVASVHTTQDSLLQTESSQVSCPSQFKSSQTWSTSPSLLLLSPSQSPPSTATSCCSGTLGLGLSSLVPSPELCHHCKTGLSCSVPEGHLPHSSPLQ